MLWDYAGLIVAAAVVAVGKTVAWFIEYRDQGR